MKKAFVSLVVCMMFVCLTFPALAKEDKEIVGFFQLLSGTPEINKQLTFNGGYSLAWKNGLGLRTFFLFNKSFAQAHIGPTWKLFDWLKMGVSLGGQQAPEGIDLRTSYLLWMGWSRFSFCGMLEVGEKAYQGNHDFIWYDFTFRTKVTGRLTFGIKDRRPSGVGPLAEVYFPAVKGHIWTAWVPLGSEDVEFVVERFILGVKLGF
ncbi:MAG TPA: hypothetical protein VKP03_02480 [Patescibacteria group bacterium]|nr:hypothetical protein [Patescibacteria group bacterium]